MARVRLMPRRTKARARIARRIRCKRPIGSGFDQGPRSSGRQVVRTQHGYAFKSRLVHKSCGRRMQGNWAHGEPYYRCRFPQEYAIANKVDHPLNVYLREDDLRAQVDPWLARAFAPAAIEHTLTTLDAAQPSSDGQGEALRKKIAECDRKIAQHRAVLEAGGDPKLVAGWTLEVQAQKATAQAQLAQLGGPVGEGRRMSRDEIKGVVEALGGLL